MASLGDIGARTVAYTHPDYTLFQPIWAKLADVREGTGRFLTGEYLVAHPREWQDYQATNPRKPTKKLKARRSLASYDNFAATVIESFKSALFRESVTRRVGPPTDSATPKEPTPIERWWQDVDGRGCPMDSYIKASWDPAAVLGHSLLYLDTRQPSGETAADAGMPYLRQYTPLDLLDWLEDDDGVITSVKLAEAPPRTSFQQMAAPVRFNIRIVDQQSWALYDPNGKVLEQGDHGIGEVPVAWLFTNRRPFYPHVGLSVLGDPQNFIDVYNQYSEIRELERNQTFSILNVPLGTGADAMSVESARALMGSETGTDNVLFSGSAAGFISADSANITVYLAVLAYKLRTIYRQCGIAWESDTKDAEATGSLQLKREELNTRLASFGDECEETEKTLARLWYKAVYGADLGMSRFEKDQVVVHYPDTFEMEPFDAVLAQAQSAMTLGYPTEVLKEIRKYILPKFFPRLLPDELKALEDAIDKATPDLTPAEQAQAKIDAQAKRGKGFAA